MINSYFNQFSEELDFEEKAIEPINQEQKVVIFKKIV